ncbi:flagellar biosynthetic protein FliO [Methylophilus medardicus]|uniref:Flagellar protein n=1 Tax=Methylophilus medardicus TaxID=2588534 RepID=A0A5B8CSR0_9PROT|nr:flagellar biosynthetic protein FliO [Methylophilus medardicus]QDC44327.1 flagellar biosynthetic protein FliO [Methylophilus medardicus]QDC49334.1 flagellar biosynthetic protein FliO [Methylophilus medardicus]QDC53039.1 flagellar biosynthetic protein FliO [Methylophilus medardicus]
MHIKHIRACFIGLLSSLTVSVQAWATVPATTAMAAPTTGDSLGRMVFGTVIVLLVIAVIAWIVRRVLPGQALSQRGVIKQVGGLQLGPRERVVVLEVGGRWLVIGLNASQMTALGEVDPVQATPSAEDTIATATNTTNATSATIDPNASFAIRLQQAMQATLQNTVKSLKNKP